MDRQSSHGLLGDDGHTIQGAFRDAWVFLTLMGCRCMLQPKKDPVRRQADPSPPDLRDRGTFFG